MNPAGILANSDLLIALSASISVCGAILVIAWPYFARDELNTRMAQVASERERIRARERARLNPTKKAPSLRKEPKKLFKAIVDRFDLASQVEGGDLAQKLRMAGYRGESPVITFLAIRAIAPLVIFLLALFYVFAVLRLQHPMFVKLGISVVGAWIGYFVPPLYLQNKIKKRQESIQRSWPDALDLLLICVECGMGIESALRKVSEEIGVQSIELAEELSLTTAELSYLQDRRKAYDNLGERTGLDGVKSVVTSLIQSEKYGTPLAHSLRVLAQENRDMRMSEAEKKAAALPPKLTVPMILFFLPVLFAVIITPAIIRIMIM
ncbi:type II secretion system F family protein [Microvirga solisilvae]|uniref:type II secretion system F family protein n=1 Tax=Microvirga solisilvae TaxID=2919498 RepID=UPI001FAF7F55|nr:type II secretion system F family protein [Microvirga solisilvae]